MENFNIGNSKAAHIAANFKEDIEKAERKQLTGGEWKTINSAKVYVKGGKVVAGAEGKLSGEGGSKSGSSKSSGETQEQKNDRITLQQLERNHRNDSDGHVKMIRDQVKKERDNTSFTNSAKRMDLSRKLKGYDALLKNRKEGGKTQDQIKESKSSTKTKESKSPLDKDNDKPLTEKQANPDKFKKPAHEKTKAYKEMAAKNPRALKNIDQAHKLSEVPSSKLSSADKKSLDNAMQDIYNELPVGKIDVNEKHTSGPFRGQSIYDADEKKTAREYNKWHDKHNVDENGVTPAAFRDALNSEFLGEYVFEDSVNSVTSIVNKLADKYHEGKDPNQLRMFKSQTMEDNIEKGKKVPVGTVSRGYKKMAEGKWVPVKDEKKKESPKKESSTGSTSKEIKDAVEDNVKDIMSKRNVSRSAALTLTVKNWKEAIGSGKVKEEDKAGYKDAIKYAISEIKKEGGEKKFESAFDETKRKMEGKTQQERIDAAIDKIKRRAGKFGLGKLPISKDSGMVDTFSKMFDLSKERTAALINKYGKGSKKEGGEKKGGKSKEASAVLQLMDKDPDADYGKALKKVLKENPSVNRAELEKELDKYI